MNLDQIRKRLPAITSFLAARGAEVLAPTNDYEVLRFRTSRGVSVVYRRDNGLTTCTGEAQAALHAFTTAGPWTSGNAKARRKALRNTDVLTLVKRDGPLCFYCIEHMGDDMTVEHLLAKAFGGNEHIANKVLAHHACNAKAGHLPVIDKVRLREARLVSKVVAAGDPERKAA